MPAQALAEAIDESEAEVVEQILEDEDDELLSEVDGVSLEGDSDAADEDGLSEVDVLEESGEVEEEQPATTDLPADVNDATDEQAQDEVQAVVEDTELLLPEAMPEQIATEATEDEPEAPADEDPDLVAQSTGKVLADMDLSSAMVTLSTSIYTYNGAKRTPAVTVVLDGVTLTKGTHYTVSYKNNVKAGTATATVTVWLRGRG